MRSILNPLSADGSGSMPSPVTSTDAGTASGPRFAITSPWEANCAGVSIVWNVSEAAFGRIALTLVIWIGPAKSLPDRTVWNDPLTGTPFTSSARSLFCASSVRAASRSHRLSCVVVSFCCALSFVDDMERLLQLRRRGAAFAHQREHGGGVAKLRAVIGAISERHLRIRRRERRQGGGEGQRRPFLVAEHGEASGKLRAGDRRRKRVDLRVGVIAQIAEHAAAGPRQHIERIGKVFAALLEIARVVDRVLQPVERDLIIRVADGVALFPRAGQEVASHRRSATCPRRTVPKDRKRPTKTASRRAARWPSRRRLSPSALC